MSRFEAHYYERFYGDGGVHDREKISRLATAVHEMCAWWDVEPTSVLDIGAGPGLWRDWYRDTHPSVKVTSTDVSEYACKRYGHQHRDISRWKPRARYDLVVCHGVLQYPSGPDVEAAIHNIAAACRHVLYLEIPTMADFETVVDTEATDMNVHHRSGNWYRRRLGEHFTQAGAGLWVRHGGGVVLYELERSR